MVKRVKNEALETALKHNAILLAELAKVESRVARGHDPAVKSRRKQNKKQVELDVNQFISKTKPKDQLTERLQGARIKLALDNQYNKLISEAQGKRKADIGKIASESQDVKLDKAHIEGKKQEKLLLLKAEKDAIELKKDVRHNLLMDKLQSIGNKQMMITTPMTTTPMKAARGRPPGSTGKSKSDIDNRDKIVSSLDDETNISLKEIAKAEKVNIKGLRNKDDIKQAILDQRLLNPEPPGNLFQTMEEQVNEPRQNPFFNLAIEEADEKEPVYSLKEQKAQKKAQKAQKKADEKIFEEYREQGLAIKKTEQEAEEAGLDAVEEAIKKATKPTRKKK